VDHEDQNVPRGQGDFEGKFQYGGSLGGERELAAIEVDGLQPLDLLQAER
jgi:hypothetical protein